MATVPCSGMPGSFPAPATTIIIWAFQMREPEFRRKKLVLRVARLPESWGSRNKPRDQAPRSPSFLFACMSLLAGSLKNIWPLCAFAQNSFPSFGLATSKPPFTGGFHTSCPFCGLVLLRSLLSLALCNLPHQNIFETHVHCFKSSCVCYI